MCAWQLIDEHQHQLHKLRGKLAADKEAQRKWHVEELRRHQEKHATEIARYQPLRTLPSVEDPTHRDR